LRLAADPEGEGDIGPKKRRPPKIPRSEAPFVVVLEDPR
jgi:hypothetical protein